MQLAEAISVLDHVTQMEAERMYSMLPQTPYADHVRDVRESVAAAVLAICVALGCPSDRADVIAFLSSQPR